MQQRNHHVPATAEEMIRLASAAALGGETELRSALDDLPAPIYVTDADGWIVYFNRACQDFAGRAPVAGQDRWCVTWRLYTEDGAPLPHEQCPLALTIREKSERHGVIAIAERPDGSRVMFTPCPSLVRDHSGRIIGAVNVLVDVTDQRQSAALEAQAKRCRRLARSVSDTQTVSTLLDLASEYETKARKLEIRA